MRRGCYTCLVKPNKSWIVVEGPSVDRIVSIKVERVARHEPKGGGGTWQAACVTNGDATRGVGEVGIGRVNNHPRCGGREV